MTEEISNRIGKIETPMVEAAATFGFLESELDDLRCLIRLTVEFDQFLDDSGTESSDSQKLRYVGESIFSGVDSFCNVSAAYRAAAGAHNRAIDWSMPSSIDSLTEVFRSEYNEFQKETDFRKQCTRLLDLFKLQIIFAGASYE